MIDPDILCLLSGISAVYPSVCEAVEADEGEARTVVVAYWECGIVDARIIIIFCLASSILNLYRRQCRSEGVEQRKGQC